MKILFVIPGIGWSGGAEQSLLWIARELAAKGIHVDIVVLTNRVGLAADFEQAGIRIKKILPGRLGVISQVFGLRQYVRERKPDIIHSILHLSDFLVRFAFLDRKLPLVTTWANTSYSAERKLDSSIPVHKILLYQWLDKWSSRLTNTWVHAVTQGVAEDGCRALSFPASRVFVVERCRNPETLGRRTEARRKQKREALGFPDSKTLLLSVARHVQQKGLDILLQSLSLLVKRGHDRIHLLVAGEEHTATQQLKQIIEILRLEPYVSLLGSRNDVPDLLCAADLFVLSSRYEGAAGALIEALALEIPIVTTDLVGTRGVVIQKESAVIVPSRDVEALANGIELVLADAVLANKMTHNGRRVYESRFIPSVIASQTIKMYQDILAKNR